MKYKWTEIKLAEDGVVPTHVQLLREGSFEYYADSKLEITADDLKNMVKNFNDDVLKTKIMIDYEHNSHSIAAGWVNSVSLENKDTEMWIDVEWTKRGEELLGQKEYRYLSVDFEHDYKDNESGKTFGKTLKGGGLTNRPFVKGMDAILHDKAPAIDKAALAHDNGKRIISNDPKKEIKIMDFAELKTAIAGMTLNESEQREVARLAGLEIQDTKLSAQIVTLKADVETKTNEIVKLSESIKTLEMEKQFDILLSTNQACPAQKDAFMSGDVAKFAELNVKANFKASGSGTANDSGEKLTAATAEKKLDAAIDKIMLSDKDTSYSMASKQALSEDDELAKFMDAA